MAKRKYYSQRKGFNSKFTLEDLRQSYCSTLRELYIKGYFDEWFGHECCDGDVVGKAGFDKENYIFIKTRRRVHWPIFEDVSDFDEDTLFDMIEFFYDTVSFPINGYFHSFNNCGMHYDTFDQVEGQRLYTENVNELLSDYSSGYYLGDTGEIEMIHAPELNNLMKNDLPYLPGEELQIKERVDLAIAQFRNRHSSFTERQSAVRELANVLEHILPLIKSSMLTKKDESDLFNIANNFCIRHNDKNQKNDYSIEWLSWIFHFYLATIHLCLWTRKRSLAN